MRRPLALCAALAAGALLPGCAAIPAAMAVGAMAAVPGDKTPSEDAPVQPSDPLPAQPAPLALQPLEPQTLAPGECGLFLFARGPDSAFVLFAPGEGAAARIRLGDAPLALTRVAAADETAAEADEFSWEYEGEGGALSARLRARSGEALPQGRRIPQASLRLSRKGGAAVVVPLTGLVACQAQ